MIIRSVNTYPLDYQLDNPLWNSLHYHPNRPLTVVEITTEDGHSGWGAAPGSGHEDSDVLLSATNVFPGSTISNWRSLLAQVAHPVRQNSRSNAAESALECALLDAITRAKDLQLAHVLGALRTKVPAYASGGYYPANSNNRTNMLQDEVTQAVADGYKFYKMKIGRGTLDEDLMDVSAAIEAGKDNLRIAVDSNCADTLSKALVLGKELQSMGVIWYEEPLPRHDFNGYRELRDKLDIPITGAEALSSKAQFFHALSNRVFDAIQPDLAGTGGFRSMADIAALAEVSGCSFMPHCWADSLTTLSTLLHVSTLPKTLGIIPDLPPLLECDITENKIRNQLLEVELKPQPDGYIELPVGSGLGIDVNREALARFA